MKGCDRNDVYLPIYLFTHFICKKDVYLFFFVFSCVSCTHTFQFRLDNFHFWPIKFLENVL